MNDDIIIINSDELSPPDIGNGLWENRENNYFQYDLPGVPICSICIQGYNRLNKTKYAVECVLKYTQDIDYELILVDNGSDDGTFEYFKSVEYDRKTIIRVTKNISSGFTFSKIRSVFQGKYLVTIPNDVYVTKGWLSNILKCYESDPQIGLACPVSSNVSNYQQVDFDFKNFDQMQEQAAKFNHSDSAKWSERMRMISLVIVWSRAVMDIVGLADPAYIHDFGDDDFDVRLRRAGYKLILLEDTWVCHDHDIVARNTESFRNDIENGRATYREKYHGIDPWDDINNYEFCMLNSLDNAVLPSGTISSLCVDVRCGAPVLEIRNRLRRRGFTDVKSSAFTTKAKYYLDLQTTGANVECDRIDFIQSKYANNSFDIVVLGQPINTYSEPIMLLQTLYNFLKPGGLLLFKLCNTDNYKAFLRSIGLHQQSSPDMMMNISTEDVTELLKLFGGKNVSIAEELYRKMDDDKVRLMDVLNRIDQSKADERALKLCVENYVFKVIKG